MSANKERANPSGFTTATVVVFALAGFFFWVLAEIRWTQLHEYNDNVKQQREFARHPNVSTPPVSSSPGVRTEVSGPVQMQMETETLEADTKKTTFKYNYGAFNQLIRTCRYWSDKEAVERSAVNQRKAACKRMREYAHAAGYDVPPTDSAARSVHVSAAPQPAKPVSKVRVAAQPSPRCLTINERIDWLQSRLRAGYRVAEGERWKQQLRDLKKEKRERC